MTGNMRDGESKTMNVIKHNTFKIAFISSWLDNPYKRLLSGGLESLKYEVSEHFSNNFFLLEVLRENPGSVHFHTLHEFIVSRYEIYSWIKLLIFVTQLFILRILGVRVVWTVHEWRDKICAGKHNISSRKAQIIGVFIDAFITHCESTRQEIIQAFSVRDFERVLLIPHGNYIGYYKNEVGQLDARKKLGLQSSSLIFLIFGGIHRSKGVLEAISAFKNAQVENAYLVIAGEASDMSLKSRIHEEIGTSNKIIFIPRRVPDDEVQVYMNACDCVLIPYTVFTTSGVALLSMSFGKPCVVPEAGFFMEILDSEGAFFYEPDLQNGLEEAISLVDSKKELLQAMGSHNFRMAKKWNWKCIAEKTIKSYK